MMNVHTQTSPYDLLHIYLEAPAIPGTNGPLGIPVMLLGPPGIGKSDRVELACEDAGLACYTTYGSAIRPEDIPGLPVIDEVNGKKRTVYTVPEMVWRALEKPTALFFDELTGAERDVQQSMLGVVQRRYCGPHPLPLHTRIILAANPAASVGGISWTHAMANRMAHLQVRCDNEEWIAWWTRQGTRKRGKKLDMARFLRAWPRFEGAIAGFIRSNPTMLHSEPKGPERFGAWPSPRSVTNAARAIVTAYAMDLPHLAVEAAGNVAGQGWATSFTTWLTDQDLPDPFDVINGKVELAFKRRPDFAWACSSGLLSALATMEEATGEQSKAVWNAHRAISAMAADVGEAMLQTIFEARPGAPLFKVRDSLLSHKEGGFVTALEALKGSSDFKAVLGTLQR